MQPRWVRIDKTLCERNESGYPSIADMRADIDRRGFVPCVDGSELARRIFTARRWSVQPCVRPVSAVHMTAYPGSIPDVVSNT